MYDWQGVALSHPTGSVNEQTSKLLLCLLALKSRANLHSDQTSAGKTPAAWCHEEEVSLAILNHNPQNQLWTLKGDSFVGYVDLK